MSYGVGHRCSSDPTLLWLWHRPAVTALIQLLAWEPLYAAGVALKRQKTKKKAVKGLISRVRNGEKKKKKKKNLKKK